MPVKLSVVNEEDDEDTPSDHLFDDDEVTIGRSEGNHLTLPDPKRIVSSEHAMVRRENDSYRLIDRGSKNFTYVGNQRITAQGSYELSDGDVFQIGDFRIEFRTLDTTPRPSGGGGGETVFDHNFKNPFEDPIDRLVDVLSDLEEVYQEEAPQRRTDALEDALQEVDSSDELETARQVLASMGLQEADAPTPSGGSTSTPSESTPSSTENQSSTGSARKETQVQDVLDVLTEALAKVVRIPWRFRHEFIGQTVMQAPETQFLYSGEGETLKEHLLDASVSEDVLDERLGYVEDAADALAVHQVAMLNGYKASVMTGAEEVLDRLDPDEHQDAVLEESPLFECLPILASPQALERVRAKWQELKRGDGATAEKRVFRPAFTKAYLARMTAPGHGEDDSSDEDS